MDGKFAHNEHTPIDPRERAPLPTLEALAAQYDYTVPKSKVKPVDLGIDWEGSETSNIHLAIQLFDTYTRPEIERADPPTGHYGMSLEDGFIDTRDGESLNMSLEKEVTFGNPGTRRQELLKVQLRTPDDTTQIAEFVFDYTHDAVQEHWNLTHRIVHAPFRRQGVGDRMLTLFEAAFAERVHTAKLPQVLNVNTAQADVLLIFLKRGYTPATIDDVVRLSNFLAGDEDLTITSSPKLKDIDGPKHWYIFEKHRLPAKGSLAYKKLWQEVDNTDPLYLAESFRINLQKRFE